MKIILFCLAILLSFVFGIFVYRCYVLDVLSDVCVEFYRNLKTNKDKDNDNLVYSAGSFDTLKRIAEKLKVNVD